MRSPHPMPPAATIAPVMVEVAAVAFVDLMVPDVLRLNVTMSERSAVAGCATVIAAPALTCLRNCEAPHVAEKSVVPAGQVRVFVPATAAAFCVSAPDVAPLSLKLPSP